MGVPTYQPIANITLGSAAASVTFSGITQAYRDLIIVTNVSHSSSTEADILYSFNGDGGSGSYSRIAMTGNGSSTGTFAFSGENYLQLLQAGTTISTGITNIMDYSSSDKHKPVLARGNLTAGRVSSFAGRWANNSAITSVTLSFFSGSFTAGSTFALYGVLA